jgi:uncharacterized protein (DUF58 family)
MKHFFRIASCTVPFWLAWYVACSAPHRDALSRVVSLTLAPLWIALAGALLLRTIAAIAARRRGASGSLLECVSVLTSSGAVLAWTSALAVSAAVAIGYASLAVVGLLGTAAFHVVALYAIFALRLHDPMRSHVVARSFVPGTMTEGDEAIERIEIAGARIPLGFRLFVSARVGPRWATSRHVIESVDSGAHVVLEADVGPAVRGDHDAEPGVVWLEDVFGLTRSRRIEVGAARVTVVPKVHAVDEAVRLLDRGVGPRAAKATRRLPTEGAFALREYREGDDVRRIHWVRSLAAGELIVRLPDEVPPDRPRVRLVLDTFFPEALAMTGGTPGEMLDALVHVWLAVGRALAAQGVRVTLAAAVPHADGVRVETREMTLRAPQVAQRFGAAVSWQGSAPVDALLTDEATFVVSRTLLTAPPSDPRFRWILVTPPVPAELVWPIPQAARLSHPMGSPDNRLSARKRAVERFVRARGDHARMMLAVGQKDLVPPPGSFVAGMASDGTVHLRAIS